ncbi:MAG: SpoIID/LytB domain-containing protein [Clostridia bacterium]|nr:SpoIID/LytB domain-containing protein [Clostridia bacterium]
MARKSISILLCCLMILAICIYPAQTCQAEERGIIRVLLTRLALTDQLSVSLDGSYTVGSMAFQRGSKLVFSCATGHIVLYYEGMAIEMGDSVRLVRHQVTDESENGIRLKNEYPLYCGDLNLYTDGKQLTAVLHIPVEEYLLGVLPYEMNEAFPIEALKAQAVAARSYAIRKQNSSGLYDVTDNTNDQVYRGYQKENKSAVIAVKETEGVCGFDKSGKVALCWYTASNGGQVELAETVWGQGTGNYVEMHDDPYDLENPESEVRSAKIAKKTADGMLGTEAFTNAVMQAVTGMLQTTLKTEDISELSIIEVTGMELFAPYAKDSKVMTKLSMKILAEFSQPYVADEPEMSIAEAFQIPVQLGTEEAVQTQEPATAETQYIRTQREVNIELPVFTCVEPYLGLSINSNDNEILRVEELEDGFEITSRRFGHGVGMSQRGAQQMAGVYSLDYLQILKFYYPGLTFRKMDTAANISTPVAAAFLSTPGPAASPTPRPTLMPASHDLAEGEYRVSVTQIGVNSSLNLRSEPSTNGEILRVLYYGQELIVTQNLGNGWLKVKTDVIEGYVMEKFVDLITQ